MRWTPIEKRGWHLWFAWFPVELEDGSCVWLETVERRVAGHAHRPAWIYRLPGSNDWPCRKPVAAAASTSARPDVLDDRLE